MEPISRAFVAELHRFARDQGVPLVDFAKGQRKDDVAHEFLAGFDGDEGVLFVGRAQERTAVFRTEKRRNPVTGATYPWIVRSTAMVNHFYVYAVDEDFGPFFIKFASYFPYTAKLCINGNEWAKRQAAKAGIGFEALDNGFAACDDPARVAADLRPARPGADRRAAAQVAGPAAAPVHRRRPPGRLPLRHLGPAGRVLPHPDAGPARCRGGCSSRRSSARTSTSAAPTGCRSSSTGASSPVAADPTPTRFRTRVFTDGVTPSLHVEYKSTRVKQYHKEGRALRTETTINDSRDFGIGKRLCNLPALREVGFSANRRLLAAERINHDPTIGEEVFTSVAHPAIIDGQRVPALRFGDPRVHALLAAIAVARLQPDGFTNRHLRSPPRPAARHRTATSSPRAA